MVSFAPRVRSVGLFVVLSLTVIVGCGSEGDGYKGPRGQVSGTVTFQGKAIPAGSAVLFQGTKGAAYVATGTVNADGKYSLVYRGKPGLPGVTYLVQISQPPSSGAQSVTVTDISDPAKIDGTKLAEAANQVKGPFPSKYNSTATSGLTFTVKEGQNTADFTLAE